MRNFILSLILLGTVACGGGGASSESPKLEAVYVRLVVIDCGTDKTCITQSSALEAFEQSKVFYREQLGREIYLSGVDVVTDPTPGVFMNISEFYKTRWRYYDIKKHLNKIGVVADSKRGEFLLIFDKYLLDAGTRYTAGLSRVCGLYDSDTYSVVYAASVSSNTAKLQQRMNVVAAHEMGHWHGASHADFAPPNFMRSDTGYEDVLHLPAYSGTISEINRCMSRRVYVKIKSCNSRRRPKKCKVNAGLRSGSTSELVGEIFGAVE